MLPQIIEIGITRVQADPLWAMAIATATIICLAMLFVSGRQS